MIEPVRRIEWPEGEERDIEPLLTREWLVTNGLGGYASGTISGVVTRRFHGLLIAALSAPLGRTVMFNHLSERIRLSDGRGFWLAGEERTGGRLEFPGASYLREFRLEAGMPVWRFEIDGVVMEKRIQMLNLQNTIYINYSILSGDGTVRLKLRPAVHFRPHEGKLGGPIDDPYVLTAVEDRIELTNGQVFPPLRMLLYGRRKTLTLEPKTLQDMYYRIEAGRGYEHTGDLWSPGYFGVDLEKGLDATLVASTEPWEMIKALQPEEALSAERERRKRLLECVDKRASEDGIAPELILAADQFIIKPAGRLEDAARAHAAGEEVRTVIAGYHWFTDWGRDTMISLDGLTLATGRHLEAGWILRTFAYYVRDGLIPNMFPEGEKDGLYHTADATLWFFHAIDKYLSVTNDTTTLSVILPRLLDIVDHHLTGTRFGIGVDPKDGLLRQGAEGYQLTWMDAKCGDWVVTPRRGKAVELNALWYNALRLLEQWVRDLKGEQSARFLAESAERVYKSFNERFWYSDGGYLYDVVDGEPGNDPACRPNQLLAISLRHPILERPRWEPVLKVVLDRLVTPVGLRSLAPGHPDYKENYHGDLLTRDAAYHQGTVWAWLIGPFIDAWLKVYPNDRSGARRFLEGFSAHLNEACVGSISEVFDAESPFTPRGCVAQAWSVAEVLRCWLLTAE
jgi:predicted glycogen debranching enzyme